MKIRHATIEDAPAMGEVMVASFLAAHRDHYPVAAWQKRVEEWTPAVSAASWAESLHEFAAMRAADNDPDFCLFVAIAEDDIDENETVVGLIYGYAKTDDSNRTTGIGEIGALYIKPSAQGQGAGRQLVKAAATYVANIGMTTLHIGVLAANTAARRFYEAIGGQVATERFHEEEGFQLPEVVYSWPDIRVFLEGEDV